MDGSRRPKSRPGPTQGGPRRPKNQQKRCTVVVFSGFGRTRPESHRVRTRRRPRAPQGAPGAAQEPPKSRPDGPRAAKSRPGRRQGPPGGPQEGLRSVDFRHRFSQFHRCFSSRGPQEPPRTARKPKTACPRGPEARNLTIMLSEITVQKVCRDRSTPNAQRTCSTSCSS